MDFKDTLLDIKNQLRTQIDEKKRQDAKNESIANREKRLQKEFLDFIKHENIKKI